MKIEAPASNWNPTAAANAPVISAAETWEVPTKISLPFVAKAFSKNPLLAVIEGTPSASYSPSAVLAAAVKLAYCALTKSLRLVAVVVTCNTGCKGAAKLLLPESATSMATPSELSEPPTWCFLLLPLLRVTWGVTFPLSPLPVINDARHCVVFRVAMDSLITWR